MDTEKVRANLTALYSSAAALYEGEKTAHNLDVDLTQFLHDDIALYNPDSTPWGGMRRGKQFVMESMPGIQAGIGTTKVGIRAILIDGQEGLVLVDVTYANEAGETAETTAAEYFRFDEDGKVVEVIPHFFDTAAMLAFKGIEAKV